MRNQNPTKNSEEPFLLPIFILAGQQTVNVGSPQALPTAHMHLKTIMVMVIRKLSEKHMPNLLSVFNTNRKDVKTHANEN